MNPILGQLLVMALIIGAVWGVLFWFAKRGDKRRAASRASAFPPREAWEFVGDDAPEKPARGPDPVQALWQKTLGVAPDCTLEQCQLAYRMGAKKAHPDRGGLHSTMADLNRAIAEARRFFQ